MVEKKRLNCIIVYSSKKHVDFIEHILNIVQERVISEGYNPILLRDEIRPSEDYLERIVDLINNSALGIVILDGFRPNVIFEFGILAGLEKCLIVMMSYNAKVALKNYYKQAFNPKIRDSILTNVKFDSLKEPKINIPMHFSDFSGKHIAYYELNSPENIRNVINENLYKIRSCTLKKFEEALEIDEKLGNLEEKAINLNNIGLLLKTRGELDKALKNFKEALKIEEKLGNLEGKAPILNNIGGIFQNRGEHDKALKYYESALVIAEELGNLEGQSNILNNIGGIFQDRGEHDKALKYYESALEIAEELGYLEGQSTLLNNIGLIFQDRGELDKSLKYYESALEIVEELGNLKGQSTLLNNIGRIFQDRGELDKSLKYYEKALEIDEKLGNLEGKSTVLNNIGSIFKARGELDKSLKYYEEALEILMGLELNESLQTILTKKIKKLKREIKS